MKKILSVLLITNVLLLFPGKSQSQETKKYTFVILEKKLENVFLRCCDEAGNTIWHKVYGGSKDDEASEVIRIGDGGYIVVGKTASRGNGSYDAWILKLDSEGNLLWDKTYGGEFMDYLHCVFETKNGDFIVAGGTKSKGEGEYDAWVMRLDSSGNIIWDKTFGGAAYDSINSMLQINDNEFLLAGENESKGDPGANGWILKLNFKGDLIWDKTYGGINWDYIASIKKTKDGNFITCGWTSSKFSGAQGNCWVFKIDPDGNLLWEKTYGTKKEGESGWLIQETADNGFIVGANTWKKKIDEYDIWIFKIDAAGNMLWDKKFGQKGSDYLDSIDRLPDNNFMLKGWIGGQLWILKLDDMGNIR